MTFSCVIVGIIYKKFVSVKTKQDLERGVHTSKRATCFDARYVIVKLTIPKYTHTEEDETSRFKINVSLRMTYFRSKRVAISEICHYGNYSRHYAVVRKHVSVFCAQLGRGN